jgi:hypothetical protein
MVIGRVLGIFGYFSGISVCYIEVATGINARARLIGVAVAIEIIQKPFGSAIFCKWTVVHLVLLWLAGCCSCKIGFQ